MALENIHLCLVLYFKCSCISQKCIYMKCLCERSRGTTVTVSGWSWVWRMHKTCLNQTINPFTVSLKLVFHSEVQGGSLVCVWVWKGPVRRKLMPWRAQPHPPCIVSTASPHPIAISLPTFIQKWGLDSVQCLYCINPVLPTQKQLRISSIFETRLDPHDGKTSPRRFGSVAAGSETGKGCGCHGDHCPEITSVDVPQCTAVAGVYWCWLCSHCKNRPSFVFLARFLVQRHS